MRGSKRTLIHCPGPSRREALQVGALGALGLSLPELWRSQALARAAGSQQPARAKSCIVLFLCGGPSQHDTWDPKPEAPAEVRGPFRPIATSVPGIQVCELMPRVARLAHQCCVLRAVSTGDNAHASSLYYLLTGHPHQPMNTEGARPGAPNDRPHFGSALRQLRERQRAAGSLPAFVTLPEIMSGNDFVVPSGQFAGALGRRNDPWVLNCDPAAASFQVPALGLPSDVAPARFTGRRSLLDRFAQAAALDRSATVAHYDLHAVRAMDLLGSSSVRHAFELDREPTSVRDRYGRSKVGQSVLLARRLVEAGVSLVQVNWPREPNDRTTNNPLWDTHSNHNNRMRDVLMPQMDLTYSALLTDLSERGMLDETLVVWLGEFGRTPRLNSSGGRDHWGGVFSVALAGAGVRGGAVLGASDRQGAFPRDGRVLPPDLLATICHALGYPPAAEIHDVEGRPHPLSRGEPIRAIF
jgi:hypothetical protein